MSIIGLTGGIGSGKSVAAAMFAALGGSVIDTDVIARTLTQAQGAALPALHAAFDRNLFLPDGSLNRSKMRALIFADVSARQRLEALLHPMIGAEARQHITQATHQGAPYIILAVPLLAETGAYRDIMQRVALVDCPPALQIERTMARNGLTRDEVQRIIAAQASRTVRQAIADDIIDNSGSLAHLQQQVTALHSNYISLK